MITQEMIDRINELARKAKAEGLTEEEKAKAPKVTGELLKRVFSYLKPYSGHLVLVIVCIAASSFFTLLPYHNGNSDCNYPSSSDIQQPSGTVPHPHCVLQRIYHSAEWSE